MWIQHQRVAHVYNTTKNSSMPNSFSIVSVFCDEKTQRPIVGRKERTNEERGAREYREDDRSKARVEK